MGVFDALREGQIDRGHWGSHTSSIDWCELNYTHSRYIAEFVNTISNLPSILLGLYGAYISLSSGLPKRYALSYLGLTLIGVGSTGFHASLRWDWQLMDELPMIYEVSYTTYLVLDTAPTFKPRFGFAGPIVMVLFNIFITISYLYMPNPIYQEAAFAILLLTATGRNVLLIRLLPRGHPARSATTRMIGTGIIVFAASFAVWNIDNIFCQSLRRARQYMGIWGIVLEGHGYWHVGTGYGAFLILTAAIYLQLSVKVSPDAYTFDPTSWFPVTRPCVPVKVGSGEQDLGGGAGSPDPLPRKRR